MSDAPSILDVVEDELCNDDDRLHAVLPTGRDGTLVFLFTVREQPGREGRLLHLRFATVDVADGTAGWGDEGMVLRYSDQLAAALPSVLARTKSAADGSVDLDDVGPVLDSGGYDGDVEDLLTSPLAPREDDSKDRECLNCGKPVDSDADDVIPVSFGGQKMWRHRGDCPDA
jgi:hypothetical protein